MITYSQTRGREQRQAMLGLDQGCDSFLIQHCDFQTRLNRNEILFSSLRSTEIRTLKCNSNWRFSSNSSDFYRFSQRISDNNCSTSSVERFLFVCRHGRFGLIPSDELGSFLLRKNSIRSYLPESKRDACWHPLFNAPTGIRTPVLGLKGPRPSPLDDGGAGRILPCHLNEGQRFGR